VSAGTGVVIAYLFGENLSTSWHESMEALRDWDQTHEHFVYGNQYGGGKIRAYCSTEGLVKGRNNLARKFLDEMTADWLLWIDTDMGFEPDTIDQLIDVAHPTERPIIGALCFAQKMPFQDTMGGYKTVPIPTIYEWTSDEGFKVDWGYPVNNLVSCTATGSAMILIHRSVFAKIREAYESRNQLWYDRLIDPHREGEFIGEDLSFCLRARTCGIPIHINTACKTTHHKPIWLNEQDYWNHLAPPPATEEVAVIVPTRGRPQRAKPFMDSLRASTGLATAYAIVHEDDDSAEAWRAAGATVILSDVEGWAPKCNFGYRQTKESWLFFTGDDVRFHGGWLDHAMAAAGSHHMAGVPFNQVIGTNDLGNPRVLRGDHAVHWLISRSYIDGVGASWDGPGVVCHEGYRTWFADDEVVIAAKQRGTFAMALGSIVEHLHPAWGKGEKDETYTVNEEFIQADRKLFEKRLRASMQEPEAVAR
jgi:hypothetical protein